MWKTIPKKINIFLVPILWKTTHNCVKAKLNCAACWWMFLQNLCAYIGMSYTLAKSFQTSLSVSIWLDWEVLTHTKHCPPPPQFQFQFKSPDYDSSSKIRPRVGHFWVVAEVWFGLMLANRNEEGFKRVNKNKCENVRNSASWTFTSGAHLQALYFQVFCLCACVCKGGGVGGGGGWGYCATFIQLKLINIIGFTRGREIYYPNKGGGGIEEREG